jgi:hypothetical protein
MKNRIKSMMPNGITGLERVNKAVWDPVMSQTSSHVIPVSKAILKLYGLVMTL